jgi:hypothetical protein
MVSLVHHNTRARTKIIEIHQVSPPAILVASAVTTEGETEDLVVDDELVVAEQPGSTVTAIELV